MPTTTAVVWGGHDTAPCPLFDDPAADDDVTAWEGVVCT